MAEAAGHVRVHPAFRHTEDGSRQLFANGDQLVVLEGAAASKLLPRILPLLDGSSTTEEVLATLPEQVRSTARVLIERLREEGIVVEAPSALAAADAMTAAAATFLSATMSYEPIPALFDLLDGGRIQVFGGGEAASLICGSLLPRALAEPAADWHLTEEEAADVKVVIAVPAADELYRLSSWNREALELKIPWVQVLPWEGRYIAVGPLYIPNETCCFECYRIRRGVNLEYGLDDALLIDLAHTVESPRWITAVAAGLAVDIVYRWLTTEHPYLPGKLHAIEFARGLCVSHHWVLRVPRCPVCSKIAQQSPLIPWYDDPGNTDSRDSSAPAEYE